MPHFERIHASSALTMLEFSYRLAPGYRGGSISPYDNYGFFIIVYMVVCFICFCLILFCVFLLLCLCILIAMYALFCIFCFRSANWHSSARVSCAFSSVVRQMPGYNSKDGHGLHSSQLVCPLWVRIPESLSTKIVNYVVLCIVCV